MDILGKWFSPENDQEKNLLAQIKKKKKAKKSIQINFY